MKNVLKKYRGVIVILILAAVIFLYYRPLSFTEIGSVETVTAILHTVETGAAVNKPFQLSLEQIGRVDTVLSKYHYHRTFKSLFGDKVLSGEVISMRTGDSTCPSIGHDGSLVIDNHIYKVGYFNSTKGEELYAELKKCLER